MRVDKASRFKVAKQTDAVGEGAMVATLTGRDDPLFKIYYLKVTSPRCLLCFVICTAPSTPSQLSFPAAAGTRNLSTRHSLPRPSSQTARDNSVHPRPAHAGQARWRFARDRFEASAA